VSVLARHTLGTVLSFLFGGSPSKACCVCLNLPIVLFDLAECIEWLNLFVLQLFLEDALLLLVKIFEACTAIARRAHGSALLQIRFLVGELVSLACAAFGVPSTFQVLTAVLVIYPGVSCGPDRGWTRA
jgi:hypothetical protein